MQEICNYIDCNSRICKKNMQKNMQKYASLYAKYAQLYILHILHLYHDALKSHWHWHAGSVVQVSRSLTPPSQSGRRPLPVATP